ncbi:hypothetical protein TNCV_5088821 [Trichonephila clavipes]|nr:hypothetical protein TNCV_5088821 [Trichonephila clavipes]
MPEQQSDLRGFVSPLIFAFLTYNICAVVIVKKIRKPFFYRKKLIKIQKDQSYNETDAIDIDQCDNEIKSDEEINKIEFSSSEDEDLCCIAPSKKRTRVIISDFETESDLDAIYASSGKRN